jgi:rod shape-determining protein MreB
MFKSTDIGIDIGNSKISVCARGEGIVASEASFLAWRGQVLSERTLVAFGNEAAGMYEKSGGDLQVCSPMRDGVVIDCHAAGLVRQMITRKASIRPRLAKPRVLTGTLFGASPLERKAFIDTAKELRFKTPYLIEEPLAAAIGSDMDITTSDANMLVDIGDGATEAIVVSQRQIVTGGSVRIGGATIEQSLISHLRNQHGLRISVGQARRLKQELTAPGPLTPSDSVLVRGTGVRSRLPEVRSIGTGRLLALIDRFAGQVGQFVLSLLTSAPPEVAADLIRNGIHLCGGTSRIPQVRSQISAQTGLECHSIRQPEDTVIVRMDRMLTYAKHFAS